METNNIYIPTTTTGGYLAQSQPSVCPGCGKCNTCGRPYHEVPHTPAPLQPYWNNPSYTPPNFQGGQSTLEQHASGLSVWNSPSAGNLQSSKGGFIALNSMLQESYPEDAQ